MNWQRAIWDKKASYTSFYDEKEYIYNHNFFIMFFPKDSSILVSRFHLIYCVYITVY